jgi:hypothetical protein
VECRPIPGHIMFSTSIEPDGMVLTKDQQLIDSSTAVSDEVITTGIWRKRYISDVEGTNLVCWQWVESRLVPGNPMVGVKIDKDGIQLGTVRTLKDTTTITPSETVDGSGNWITVEKEAVSDLVAWEVVTGRSVKPTGAANPVISYSVDGDHETVTKTFLEKETGSITPSATESGGNITTVEGQAITDLVSQQITSVVKFLDKAEYSISIINLIPRKFMAFVPTFTESHILSGTASMPTLATGEFEHSKRQLTKLLYEERIVSLGSVSLPITHTNQETTEEYGGGVLNVTYVLETQGSGTIDEGLLITESTLTDLGNGMEVKLTKELDDAAWPIIVTETFDKEMQVYVFEETQVVDPGYTVTSGTYFVENLIKIDKWRSNRVKITKQPTAVDLGSALIESVEGPFQYPGYVYLSPTGGGYFVKRASAQLTQQTLRTWWLSSASIPTQGLPGSGADVEVQEIIMDDIVISTLNDVTQLAYSGMALHDAITTFGVFIWPATVPSTTDYIAMIGTEIVVGASIESTDIPELWKIQTKSVVAH